MIKKINISVIYLHSSRLCKIVCVVTGRIFIHENYFPNETRALPSEKPIPMNDIVARHYKACGGLYGVVSACLFAVDDDFIRSILR